MVGRLSKAQRAERAFACAFAAATLALAACSRPEAVNTPTAGFGTAFRAMEPLSAEPVSIRYKAADTPRTAQGYRLFSTARFFGGLSDLRAIDASGGYLAVSDRGRMIAFMPPAKAANAPLAPGGAQDILSLDAFERQLMGETGETLSGARGDAEGLAVCAVNGETAFLVSFERDHRIDMYAADDVSAPAARFPNPPRTDDLKFNSGLEALACRSDGMIIAISEDAPKGEDAPRASILRDGAWTERPYPRTKPFAPTAAAFLPNGDMLVLERGYFGGVRVEAKLRLIESAALDAPSGPLTGPEVAHFDRFSGVDNSEGLAFIGGRTPMMAIISDDNFNPLQRTLLIEIPLADLGL